MTIDFKTQTPRNTKFHTKVININLFCNDFEFGIITSKYWGDFEKRKEPLIELSIEDDTYQLPLSEFILRIKPIIRDRKILN
ncbi:MAG: hypothetical protein AABY22_32750 [Nanoarchaeota archaeon]